MVAFCATASVAAQQNSPRSTPLEALCSVVLVAARVAAVKFSGD
jgi:hypothetical protein